jgi:hypothetical protein
MPQVKKSARVVFLLRPVRKSPAGGLLHSNQKSDIPVTGRHLNGINYPTYRARERGGNMWNWLKLQWLALDEEGQQNFGVLLAIPPAILFGLSLIWLLPHVKQIGWSHYRLTATVMANGRTITTSQVYAYKCSNESGHLPQAACQIRGEAMAIDLGTSGQAFFVMNQWNAEHTALSGKDYMIARLNLAAKGDDYPSWNNLPAIVRFRDPRHPETAHFVDPQLFETAYSEGITLTQFKVTETGDAETLGLIQTRLPWIHDLRVNPFGQRDAAAQLHPFDFKWPPN